MFIFTQKDVLEKDYRRTTGRRFGLDARVGWVMKASVLEEETNVPMDVEGNTVVETRAVKLQTSIIPDLNDPVTKSVNEGDRLAVVPARPQARGIHSLDVLEVRREGCLLESTQPIWLFGTTFELSKGGERVDQEERRVGEDTLALTLSSGINDEDIRVGGDSPKSVNSDPFNLAPFIFGTGGVHGESCRGKVYSTSKMRRAKSRRVGLPELGKRGYCDTAQRGLILDAKKCALCVSQEFITAEAEGVQPRRA